MCVFMVHILPAVGHQLVNHSDQLGGYFSRWGSSLLAVPNSVHVGTLFKNKHTSPHNLTICQPHQSTSASHLDGYHLSKEGFSYSRTAKAMPEWLWQCQNGYGYPRMAMDIPEWLLLS